MTDDRQNLDLAAARRHFERLGTTGDTQETLDSLNLALERANRDYKALDPNGEKTAAKMLIEVNNRARTGFIRQARNWYKEAKDVVSPIPLLYAATQALDSAKAGYQALDPTGKQSAKDISLDNEYVTCF